MSFLLEQTYLITQNYGWAIILFSLILNIIILPLYQLADYWNDQEKEIQSLMKSEIDLIKKHYTGNQQYYQIQTIYKRYNYHPIMALRSSISLFLQAMFFFWAYKVLFNNYSFENIDFGLINNLNAPDALLNGINLLPFLMTGINLLAVYFYTQSKPERIKLYILGLLFLIFLYSSSSALLIYWTTNNLFALFKNTILSKFKFVFKKPLLLGLSIICVFLFAINQISLFAFLGFWFLAYFQILNNIQLYKNIFHDKNNQIIILSSLFFLSILFVFNPLFIYLSAPEIIGKFDLESFMANIIYIFLNIFIVLVLRSYFYKTKALNLFISFLICFCLIVYVYSYLINIDFGIFKDNHFMHENKIVELAQKALLPELLIWSAIFYTIYKIIKQQKTKFILNLFMVFTILASANLAHAFITRSPNNLEPNLSTEGKTPKLFELSKTKPNIILIVLDGASNILLKQIFQENPNINLDGFTHYSNVIAVGNFTLANAAPLIAGEQYTPYNINKNGSKYTILQNIKKAYSWLNNILIANNYQTTFFNPVYIHSQDLGNARFLPIGGSYYTRFLEKKYNCKQKSFFNKDLLLLFSSFKALPFTLKKQLYYNDIWNLVINNTNFGERYLTDYLFTKNLTSFTQITNNKSQFIHIWNEGLIAPFQIDENGHKLSLEEKSKSLSLESRKISHKYYFLALIEWFEWMKKNNVYDNTKIIIVSDHGSITQNHKDWNLESESWGEKWNIGAIEPILLVKDFKQRGKLQTSNKLMYNADAADIICQALKNCPKLESSIDQPNRKLVYSIADHGNYRFAEESKKFNIQKNYLVDIHTLNNPEKWQEIK